MNSVGLFDLTPSTFPKSGNSASPLHMERGWGHFDIRSNDGVRLK